MKRLALNPKITLELIFVCVRHCYSNDASELIRDFGRLELDKAPTFATIVSCIRQ
jgi:hypothetical protein